MGSHRRPGRSGRNVGVESEEIRWIVLRLEGRQAFVAGAERRPHFLALASAPTAFAYTPVENGRHDAHTSRDHATCAASSAGSSQQDSTRASHRASRYANAVASGGTRFAAFPTCWNRKKVSGEGPAANCSTTRAASASGISRTIADFQ